MNGLPYYKAYPRDFMEGTIGMPFELKGTYRLVLDLIYMQGGKLPDDPRYISALLGCSTKAWNIHRAKLVETGKLYVGDGFLGNLRADAELEKLAKTSQTQREKRLGKSKNNDLPEPQLNQPEPEPEPKVTVETDVSTDAPPRPKTAKPKPVRWDEFWDAYPRRNGKRAGKAEAMAEYARLVAMGIPEERLIVAARAYADECSRTDTFACDAVRWLKKRRWEDETADIIPLHPRTQQQPKESRTNVRVQAFLRAAERRQSGMAGGPDCDPSGLLLPRG